jgi:beta-glucosidase
MKTQTILFITTLFLFILCKEDDLPLQDYEKKHIEVMRNNSAECTLFLKKDSSFPLKSPGKVVLVGAGARGTTKGGTGSGDVESRFFTTCEDGLKNAGFEIVSTDWLDEFPKYKKARHKDFIEYIYRIAEKYDSNAGHISFGAVEPEREYKLPLEYDDAEAAFYVIGRNSGEGEDRRLVKGDIYLTNSEIRDILYLNENYEKFMLVLNVPGVVDLSPVKDVKNILLLSQLGVVTGDIFADIVLGKANPSGKLSTTWAAVKDYRYIEEFGGIDNTRYLEGVYVGYRFFDSANIKPLFPFGYGLSYTDFKVEYKGIKNNKDVITVRVKVTNIGKFEGKEVVQIYLSPSQSNKDKPYQSLVAFQKTPLLKPEEKTELNITFKLSDSARYDEENAEYILDKGQYIIRLGKSSNYTIEVAYITLPENVVTQVLKNVGGKPDFKDYKPKIKYDDDLTDLEEIVLEKKDFTTKRVDYNNYHITFNQKLMKFSDAELARMCVCDFRNTGEETHEIHLQGEAGETVLALDKIENYLVLADGPAGLRIIKKYGIDEKGVYRLCENQMSMRMKDYLSEEEWKEVDTLENNLDRNGTVYYQYATAIPTATALGQSFNEELLEIIGDVVGNEMDIFKVNLWLAPGLNIHRNIQNGRNFEYYSEDPLISGKMAAAITRGVQKHTNRATTIKHFACNGQENDRFNSNSLVSERALREIYLKGFKIAIDEGHPHTLMTSYNLINGKHSSERRDLLIDVIRIEWGYKGLIMSDWYTSNEVKIGLANHPSQHAVPNILGGNNLQMGGGKNDYDLIMKSVQEGKMNTINLLECASKVYDTIELLNQ